MATATGWRPLGAPSSRPPAPFTRLARTHALSAAGDTLVATALAGSLFFSISPDAARREVTLYLLITMAPFAVVAPLIGPWIDRTAGGRRTMVLVSNVARAVLCIQMARDLDSLLLFPEALAVLVLAKGYNVARASLVPGLVRDESELVEANSKLVLISGVVGFVAAVPGIALLQVGPVWVLALATLVFTAASIASIRIPSTRVARDRATEMERAELRGAGILLAASAMAVLRGVVGFLVFQLAFWLRDEGAATWWFGVVLAVSAVGALLGAAVAPPLRKHIREERILLGCLIALAVFTALISMLPGKLSAALLAGVVGVVASAGRLCFDAIVQRDAPDANKGRSFARFETRFQLAWVVGAFLPVVAPIPLGAGYAGIAVVSAVAALSYATGRRLRTEHFGRLIRRRERAPEGTPSRLRP